MSPFYPSRSQIRNRERGGTVRRPIAPGAPAGWDAERVWCTTGSDLRKEIAKANEEVVLFIHAREREHPRYSRDDGTRGRLTVLNGCAERLAELHAVNPNTEEGGHGLAD